jgi:hypothetical protein
MQYTFVLFFVPLNVEAGNLILYKWYTKWRKYFQMNGDQPVIIAVVAPCSHDVNCVFSALCSQVKKYRILFLHFTHDDPKAQKYLLGGIEQVIALHKDTLLPKVPGIFKVIVVHAIHPSSPTSEIKYMEIDVKISRIVYLMGWGGDETQFG